MGFLGIRARRPPPVLPARAPRGGPACHGSKGFTLGIRDLHQLGDVAPFAAPRVAACQEDRRRPCRFSLDGTLAGPGFWFFQQAAHTANAAALCLALGSLLLFLSNRFWASGVLSVLAVAMHGGGIVAPVAIVLVAAPSPRLLLRRALPIALVSILAFCPWALHMYKHTALAGLRHGTLQLEMFRVDLVLLPLALCGFVWLVRDTLRAMRRRSSEDAVPSFALPAFALSFGVMFPMAYGHRYWAFVSILSYALLGGVAADRLLGLWTPRSRRARAALLIAATGLALVFLPTWRPWPSSLPRRGPQPAHGRPRREPAKIGFRLGRPALAILATGHDSSLGKPGRPPWELRDAFALTRPVLGPGDLVFMRGSEACLLTAVTGAWTCGGMLAEVISPEPPSTPEECDYVLQVPTRRLPQDTDAGSPNRMRTTFPAPPGFEIVPLPGIGDQKTAAPPERLGLYVPRLSRSLSRTPERRDPSPAAVPMPVVLIGVAGLAAVALSDVLRGRSHPSLRTVACVLGVVAFAVFWSWLFVRVVQEEPSVRPEWRQAFEPPHASPGVPDQK